MGVVSFFIIIIKQSGTMIHEPLGSVVLLFFLAGWLEFMSRGTISSRKVAFDDLSAQRPCFAHCPCFEI